MSGAERPPDPGADPGDSIGRNAAFALATHLSTAAFTAALTVYLVRALGPAGFGTFAVALGLSGVLLRASDLGVREAAARYVAERRGDPSAIRAVIGMSLRLRIATALAMAAALFALAGPIADVYGAPELTWPLRGIAVSLLGQNVMLFARSIFTALRRTSRGLVLVSSESAVEFTASVALVALGTGASGAAFGRAIGYLFGAILGVILLSRFLGRSALRGTGSSPVGRREFSSYAGATLIVGGAFTLFSQIDVLLIGGLLGTAAAGLFTAPLRLLVVFEYPGQALAEGVAPRMARNPNEPPRTGALEAGLRYLLIFQAAVFVVILVWAEPIVDLLLGPGYEESVDVLRALSPFVFMRGLSPILSTPLNYFGEARRRIPFAIAAVVLNAAIDVALIPEIGILAAALGTNIAFAFYLGAHVWLCRSLLGLRLRGIALTTGRTLLAGAAMAGPLLLAGTDSLGAVEWIAGSIGAALVYALCLVATREVSVDEIQKLLGSARRRVRAA